MRAQLLWKGVALAVALGSTVSIASTSPASAAPTPPTKTCKQAPIRSAEPTNDIDVVHHRRVDYGPDCKVTITETTERSSRAATEPPPLETATASGTAGLNGLPSLAAATLYGNVIHGSQTLQDVVNVDIAKYRYGHDRVWDGTRTRFKSGADWWMVSSTSVTWNHPHTPASDGWDGTMVTTAYAFGHGAFHSDFLWCNLQAGQNFQLNTQLTSFRNGSYDAKFTQSRTCNYTHMATAKKADTNRAAW